MSSVGFIPRSESELEQLRAAYQSLNDLLRNLAAAEACLKNLDLKMTGDHLKVAQWNAQQARKKIESIGREKPGAKQPKTEQGEVKS